MFEKGIIDIQWAFDKEGKIGGLHFLPGTAPSAAGGAPKPPAYDLPGKYKEKEVVVGKGEWALPGTLTLPRGKGPFPAVVFIHGSGPLDRDETVGGTKVFRDLAHGLASSGIASLRYDKRTYAHREQLAKEMARITVKEETIDDALSALDLLCGRPEINRAKIVALGHSLGGMLIPRVGQLEEICAGYVIMAGTARPLEDVLVEQYTYLFSLDSVISGEEQRELTALKEKVARVKDPGLNASTPPDSLPLGLPVSYWRDLRTYDPLAAVQKLARPILILQGGRDYQVTATDFELWKKALAGRSQAAFRFYPDLNHLFVHGEGKVTPEEYMKPGVVAEPVIRDLAAWIKNL